MMKISFNKENFCSIWVIHIRDDGHLRQVLLEVWSEDQQHQLTLEFIECRPDLQIKSGDGAQHSSVLPSNPGDSDAH